MHQPESHTWLGKSSPIPPRFLPDSSLRALPEISPKSPRKLLRLLGHDRPSTASL
jgi:hypothetical protein